MNTWSESNDSEVEIVRNRTQTLAEDPAEARKVQWLLPMTFAMSLTDETSIDLLPRTRTRRHGLHPTVIPAVVCDTQAGA